MQYKKKLGLALGAGGSFGLAHLGVLSVLEKYKIPIDYISGSSIGAVIGCHYSLYRDLKKLEEDAKSFIKENNFSLFNIETVLERKKRIRKFKLYFEDIFGDSTFKDCKTPLCITAADLETGKIVYLNKGSLRSALLASISIPLVFEPVFYWGRWLVDGGFLDPIPLDILQKKNPSVLVGVDLHPKIKKIFAKQPTHLETAQRCFRIFEHTMTESTLKKIPNKIIIKPKYTLVKDLFSLETAKSYKIAGERGALQQISKIKEALDMQ